jgi:hypothetical protein
MADITMCHGTGCPYRHGCYRFKAWPQGERQAYFMYPPYDHDANRCDQKLPMRAFDVVSD